MLLQVKCVLAVESDKDVTDEEVLKGVESTLPGTTLVGTTTRTKCLIDDVEDIEISRHEREEHLLAAEDAINKKHERMNG